jgi:hypothetical protein
MKDKALKKLMSELARLFSPRSRHPRPQALTLAHARLREFAGLYGYDQDWCDNVLLLFLERYDRQAA